MMQKNKNILITWTFRQFAAIKKNIYIPQQPNGNFSNNPSENRDLESLQHQHKGIGIILN